MSCPGGFSLDRFTLQFGDQNDQPVQHNRKVISPGLYADALNSEYPLECETLSLSAYKTKKGSPLATQLTNHTI